MPPFLDMQLITASAESIEFGFDPAIENPRDFGQRVFNYPRIWYLWLNLGIGMRATNLLAIASILLFFLSLFLLFSPRNYLTALLINLVLFSPALMLGFERANVDLIFFSLIVISILLVKRFPAASLGVLLIAILGKIIPVFAAGLYLDKKLVRLAWLFPVIAIVCTAIYFVITWNGMAHIFQSTQKGTDLSYGIYVVPDYLSKTMKVTAPWLHPGAMGVALLLVIIALILGFRHSGGLPPQENNELASFFAGAGVYIGTFLLGNNWDYRLMFFLLCVPALADWAQSHNTYRFAAMSSLALVLISCWYLLTNEWLQVVGLSGRTAFFVDEAVNWLLFFSLAYLYFAAMPPFFKDKVQAFLRLAR